MSNQTIIGLNNRGIINIIEDDTAQVERENGLLIYIKSRPLKSFTPYSQPINRDVAQEIINSGKKKGFGKVVAGIFKGVSENVSFQEQVYAMTEITHELYPNADGIIFSNSLNECKAFKFDE